MIPSPRSKEEEEDSDEDDFKLPVRVKVDEVDTGFLAPKIPIKRVKSPQVKSLFQTISWKTSGVGTKIQGNDGMDRELKRKLEVEQEQSSAKKGKNCTPVTP